MLYSAVKNYGFRVSVRKAFGRVRRIARNRFRRVRDRLFETFGRHGQSVVPVPLSISPAELPAELCAYLAEVAPAYLHHRFDLLGSGWVQVAHGVVCPGFEEWRYPPGPDVLADTDGRWLGGRVNPANLIRAQAIWRTIGQGAYRPIDWQLDFKSGYRWNEQTYFSGIKIGPAAGADIKVPWELARMQHLPQLALCLMRAQAGDARFASAEAYYNEIQAQLLDFIATNPPRFGVNWVCPMDIAIRAANWLLTLDLLATVGYRLATPVLEIVSQSIADHVAQIVAHLEWSEAYRTNHYLADIVGLMYAAARLEPSASNDAYLAFAAHELISEAGVQFYPEGACYEGSTSYHRLSAELLLFGAALLAGLPEARRAAFRSYSPSAIRVRPPFAPPPLAMFPDAGGNPHPFPKDFSDRLWRAAEFTEAVTRPDGKICQIGDTDSGRLFWLHPASLGGSPPERNDLDHAAMTEAIGTLFEPKAKHRWLDGTVVRALAGTWRPEIPELLPCPDDVGDPDAIAEQLLDLPERSRRMRRYPLKPSSVPWRRTAYPQFGLYVFSREKDFVALRCAGQVGRGVPTGHRHDDNLAVEAMFDGRLVIADPGTYVYTAAPALRNQYRSAFVHDAPRSAGWSVAVIGKDLFALAQPHFASCTCWRPDAIAGSIVSPHGTLSRLIRFHPDAVEILDAAFPGDLRPIEDSRLLCQGYGRKT
jgi:hypothetical protein